MIKYCSFFRVRGVDMCLTCPSLWLPAFIFLIQFIFSGIVYMCCSSLPLSIVVIFEVTLLAAYLIFSGIRIFSGVSTVFQLFGYPANYGVDMFN